MITDGPCRNRQNRISHSPPLIVSVFAKALVTHFSVNKLQRISKLKDWKAAKTSRCNVNRVSLNIPENRNIQIILLVLMQNYDKVVARRFFVRIARRLH